MLDQAQIELGQLFFNVGPFTPHHLLQDVHAVLDVLAEQKGLQLTSEVSPAMPPNCRVTSNVCARSWLTWPATP